MKKVVLFLLTVSLSSCVSAVTTLNLKEDAVLKKERLSSVDETKENVTIASGSSLPAHFQLFPNGEIQLTDAKGADYENPKLRKFTFKVTVMNKGTGAARQEDVVINIVDVNDEPPSITGPFPPTTSYPKGLPQNLTGLFYKGVKTHDGAFIYCLNASDPDSTAKLSYSFTPMEKSFVDELEKNFKVVGVGCVVRKGNTDLPATPLNYRIPVRVTDLNSDHPGKASTDVYVSASLAFQPPQIAATPYRMSFSEGTPKDTVIGTIFAVQMTSRYNKMEWTITDKDSGQYGWPFSVDKNTGAVKLTDDTHTKLYNRVCVQQWHAKVTVTEIGSQATVKSSSTVLIIQLIDANNFRPFFEHPVTFAKVSEAIAVSQEITKVNVVDPDSSSDKDLTYTLAGTDKDYFQVKKSSQGPFYPALIYASGNPKLDYEDEKRSDHLYTFELVASDGVHPAVRTSVLVEVTNANDEKPYYKIPSATVTVDRATFPSVVYQVQARDADGSTVKYNFAGTTSNEFSIDSNTGVVKYDKKADQAISQRELTIKTTDQGDCSFCDKTSAKLSSEKDFKLIVKFIDPNRFTPTFRICPDEINIEEEKPIGTTVMQMNATDADEGKNGKITYKLKRNQYTYEPEKYFKIDPNTGVITSARKFDREDYDSDYWMVWITVEASDSGDNPSGRLSTTCTMHLKISDTNDNAPVFQLPRIADAPEPYLIVMKAKQHKRGDRIMRVFAYDADEFNTDNSKVEYSKAAGAPAYVNVNSVTGELTFNTDTTLSVSPNPLTTFNVIATDKGETPKSSTAKVEIFVTDKDEQLPPVVTYNKDKSVPENTADNADLVVITATQATGALFNKFDMPGDTAATNKKARPFAITGTGASYTVQKSGPLDAARLDHVYYSAKVQLNRFFEYNGRKMYSYALINILFTIEDVNNMKPHFITFSSSNALIAVPENAIFSKTSENPITTLFAADNDVKKEFRTVVMDLEPTKDHDKFLFDNNQLFIKGSATVSASFDFEKKNVYFLNVVAKDSPASPAKPNQQPIVLTVQVTDVNDERPYFTQDEHQASVSENAALDYPVFKLEPVDNDTISETRLTFNIENTDSPPFGINSKTGVIYVARRLNREIKSLYLLNCQVFDGKYIAKTKVKITVLNVNDEPAEFVGAPYTLPSFEITSPFKKPDPWQKFTVKDPDDSTASSAIKVTAFGRWTEAPYNYFGIERDSGSQWKFVVKAESMQPWKTTETLDRQYRFMLKAEKTITGQKTLVSYAHVTVLPIQKKTNEQLCFKPGTLLGWPKVGEDNALTLGAVDPDTPSTSANLQYTVGDTKYEVKDKNKINYKPPTKAADPNTIKSFTVTAKSATVNKAVSARAFVMVQPRSMEKPTCESTTATVYTTTKVDENFFVLRIKDKDEADRGKLTFTASPAIHPYVKLTLLKNIDSVAFSLKAIVSVGTTIANIVVSVKDSDPAISNPPNTCTVSFTVKPGPAKLGMTVNPKTATIAENLTKDLPKSLAEITVTDPNSKPTVDISMTIDGLTLNPGLELVKTDTNKAMLYVTKALDREALTTGSDDAKLVITFTGKTTTGVTRQVTDSFSLTITDVNETPSVFPMSASVLMTNAPQTVTPFFNVTDGDKPANKGAFKVEVTGSAAALFGVTQTATGFSLATKQNADLSGQSNPMFVPVKITEGSLPARTVMVKIALTDNKLTDTNREVNAVVSTGWHWYWMPSMTKIDLGNVYGKTLTPDIMSSLIFDIPDNKFWYPSYFALEKNGGLSIIGTVPAGEYTVVARAKRNSDTARATVKILVRVASNQAVQHSATIRINGLDAQHLVLRKRKSGTSGASTTDFEPSILSQIQDILAKKLETQAKKVMIISAQEFRDSKGAPYIEVLYAVSGSPYYTPSKLNYYTLQAKADLAKILPAGTTLEAPIDRCSTSGTTCPFGCVNRIRVNQKDKDVTVNPTASFVGLKVSISAVCGCEFKPDYPPPDCSINACLNDGNCTLAPGTVNARCQCPRGLGMTGPRCQKLDVNFNTRKGYVMTESIGSCSDLHVSFEFISTGTPSNEILLYDGSFVDGANDDYFLIGLQDRKPYLEILSKKGGTKKTVTINFQVSANKWYRLDAFYKRNGRPDDYMEIMIDRCRNGVKIDAKDGVNVLNRDACTKREGWVGTSELSLDRRIDVSAYPLQVGGSNLKKYQDRGLTGSIRRVRVNSKLRNLLVAKQGLSANADDNKSLNATCSKSDGKPKCGDFAVCRPGPTGEQYCKCLPGYRKDSSGACTAQTKVMDFLANSLTFWKLKGALPPASRLRTWSGIRFRTRKTFGTLLYFTSADGYRNQSVEVRLQKSRVQVVFNLGDYSFKEVTLPNMNVSDGEWHSVEVDRILNEFEIILDDGEYGNYMLFRKGPQDKFNFLTLSNEFLGGLRWKRKYSNLVEIEHTFSDISNTCLTDVRWNDEWIPMLSADEGAAEAKATVVRQQNRNAGCPNPKHCLNAAACPAPFTCVPQIWRPLTRPACGCAVGSVLSAAGGKAVCVALGVCYPNPCRAGTCQLDSSDKRGYKCICMKGYAGNNCEIALVATASLGAGLIVLIVLLLLLILLAILLYVFFVKCRRRDEKLLADPDDYTRENITPYDEEGAGEEDHDHYDLTYLRKPVTDIRPVKSVPLGAAPNRPSDLGNFLDGRLQDAENDPHGPPQDYSLDYGYEGQGSVVDDLSSLGSGTSDGSQQYDHLHNLGPKFRPLHDLYNHQRNV